MSKTYTASRVMTVYLALESGATPANIIDAMENGDLYLNDDFGREGISPRIEDQTQIRGALREYVERASERHSLGYRTLEEMQKMDIYAHLSESELEQANTELKNAIYPNLSVQSQEYWLSLENNVQGSGLLFHQINILLRLFIDGGILAKPGYSSPVTDSARLVQKNKRKRVSDSEVQILRRYAEPMILRGKLNHIQVIGELETRATTQGINITRNKLGDLVKDWCAELGMEQIITGKTGFKLKN